MCVHIYKEKYATERGTRTDRERLICLEHAKSAELKLCCKSIGEGNILVPEGTSALFYSGHQWIG